MKKVLILSVSIFSLFFLSCGTTKEASKDDSSTSTTAPVIEEDNEVLSENDMEEVVSEEIEDIEEIIEPTDTLPLPDSIKEPEVITVTPEQIEEAKENISKESTATEMDNEELVIIDELPPLPIEEIVIENPLITDEEEKEIENIEGTNLTLDENIIIDEEIEEPSITVTDDTLISDSKTQIKEDENKDTVEKTQKEETTTSESAKEEATTEAKEEVISPIDAEEKEEIVEEEKKEEIIVPSRSVTVKRREYIDITYPGKGWIYMGLTDNSKDITYFGRDLGTKDTNFSLQAKYSGTKILHFYKNDNLTGEYIDDYIEVIVLDEIGSNKTHIKAPPYKQPLPKQSEEMFYEQKVDTFSKTKEENNVSFDNEDYTTEDNVIVISDEDDVIEIVDESANEINIDTETLLKEAKLLYNEKEYSAALEKVEEFLSYAARKFDEGLYLKGQILEAKSDIQNIKGAIDAYSLLTKEYPASKYWDEANKRIVYLKRFYLEVR